MTKTEKLAHVAKMNALRETARAIVRTGLCPDCGGKLKANLSITGWWQCEQSGSVVFRKDPNSAPCGFQTFTS